MHPWCGESIGKEGYGQAIQNPTCTLESQSRAVEELSISPSATSTSVTNIGAPVVHDELTERNTSTTEGTLALLVYVLSRI